MGIIKFHHLNVEQANFFQIGEKYAVKAIQKSKILDYETFLMEIKTLKTLVSY